MIKQHDWVPSTLGHGETMCTACKMTNREAGALGLLFECDGGAPDIPEADEAWFKKAKLQLKGRFR